MLQSKAQPSCKNRFTAIINLVYLWLLVVQLQLLTRMTHESSCHVTLRERETWASFSPLGLCVYVWESCEDTHKSLGVYSDVCHDFSYYTLQAETTIQTSHQCLWQCETQYLPTRMKITHEISAQAMILNREKKSLSLTFKIISRFSFWISIMS